MLFVIDDTICQYVTTNHISDDMLLALDTIAFARKKGNHLFLASRMTLDAIIKIGGLSAVSKAIYTKVYNSLPTIMSYLDNVNTYVKITCPGTTLYSESDGNKKVIGLPIDLISAGEIMSPTLLLTESIDECEIYEFFSEAFCHLNHIPSNIKFEADHGGGFDIWKVYARTQSSQSRLCISVADTDKLYPTATLGNTAAELKRSDAPGNPLTEVYILDVHEVENLFPSKVYKELAGSDAHKQQLATTLEKLEKIHETNPSSHLDIKKGIKVGNIEKNSDNEYKKYWEQILRLIGEVYRCCGTNRCANIPKRCQSFIIKEWGSQAQKDIIAYIKAEKMNLLQKVDTFSLKLWSSIGEVIYSWCCSGPPMRAF